MLNQLSIKSEKFHVSPEDFSYEKGYTSNKELEEFFKEYIKERHEAKKHERLSYKLSLIYEEQNKSYGKKQPFCFYISLYPESYLKKNDKYNKNLISLLAEVQKEIDDIFSSYLPNTEPVDLKLSEVSGFKLLKTIELNHDYNDYKDIIVNLATKYNNLTVDYNHGSSVYFLNSSKKTKDVTKSTRYIKFANSINEKINSTNNSDTKEYLKTLKQNILLVELVARKEKVNSKELLTIFEIEKDEKLMLKDIIDDSDNNFNKLNQYFIQHLKDRILTQEPEEEISLDSDKLYEYLENNKDNKISKNKFWFYIIGQLLAKSEGNVSLRPIKSFLTKKMSKANDVNFRFSIIKKIRDYIGRNKLSSVVLYNEILNKTSDKPKLEDTKGSLSTLEDEEDKEEIFSIDK